MTDWRIAGPTATRIIVATSAREAQPEAVMGAMTASTLLVANNDQSDQEMSVCDIVHFDGRNEVIDHTIGYRLQRNKIAYADLSPDRRRVVWNEELVGNDTGSKQMAIEVVDLDGTRRQLVPVPDGKQQGPTEVCWMPDCKHISYFEDGALWSAPVE